MIHEVMDDEAAARRTAKSPPPALQASAQALTKFLENKDPININVKLKLKTIFDKIEFLIKLSSPVEGALNEDSVFHPNPLFLRTDPSVSHVRTFSPIELVCTSILIAYQMEKRSDEELLDDIKNLRRFMRIKHKDLRVNPQCWNTAWTLISTIGTDREPDAVIKAPSANGKPTRKVFKKVAPQARKGKGTAGIKRPKPKDRRTAKIPKPKPAKRRESSSSLSTTFSVSDDNHDDDDDDGPVFPGMMPHGFRSVETASSMEEPAAKKQKTS